MNIDYRKKSGALADKHRLVRFPVAPKEVGEKVKVKSDNENYKNKIICTFIETKALTKETKYNFVVEKMKQKDISFIEVYSDPRMTEEKDKLLLRVVDSTTNPFIEAYFEAERFELGHIFGLKIGAGWCVFYFRPKYFGKEFSKILDSIKVFDNKKQNKLNNVKVFQEQL